MGLDPLDAAIVELFTAEPRIGVMEASRRLSVARATVQSRLDRMHHSGALIGVLPRLDPSRFGFPVMAFCSLQISQGDGHEGIARQLESIPEITDLYTVSGAGDLLATVVARSNEDLQRVIDTITATGAVTRISSVVVLRSHFQNRMLPLLTSVAASASDEDTASPE